MSWWSLSKHRGCCYNTIVELSYACQSVWIDGFSLYIPKLASLARGRGGLGNWNGWKCHSTWSMWVVWQSIEEQWCASSLAKLTGCGVAGVGRGALSCAGGFVGGSERERSSTGRHLAASCWRTRWSGGVPSSNKLSPAHHPQLQLAVGSRPPHWEEVQPRVWGDIGKPSEEGSRKNNHHGLNQPACSPHV